MYKGGEASQREIRQKETEKKEGVGSKSIKFGVQLVILTFTILTVSELM